MEKLGSSFSASARAARVFVILLGFAADHAHEGVVVGGGLEAVGVFEAGEGEGGLAGAVEGEGPVDVEMVVGGLEFGGAGVGAGGFEALPLFVVGVGELEVGAGFVGGLRGRVRPEGEGGVPDGVALVGGGHEGEGDDGGEGGEGGGVGFPAAEELDGDEAEGEDGHIHAALDEDVADGEEGGGGGEEDEEEEEAEAG
jgi:hypothetical protein